MQDQIQEFGIKRENEERRDGGCAFVFDPRTQKYAVGEHHEGGLYRLFSGGVEEGENIQEGILREVREESGLYDFGHVEEIAQAMTHYHNKLKNVNRVAKATCLLAILNSSKIEGLALEEHEKFSLKWVTAQEILDNWAERNKDKGMDHWVYFLHKAVPRAMELGFDTTSRISV
jgi:ADP-ribose pyrophosphatase YjhB (NUDIX family)